MFTGCSLNKQRVPHPVNPEHPENPDSANKQALSPDNVAGLRREVAGAFRRCSASRKLGWGYVEETRAYSPQPVGSMELNR